MDKQSLELLGHEEIFRNKYIGDVDDLINFINYLNVKTKETYNERVNMIECKPQNNILLCGQSEDFNYYTEPYENDLRTSLEKAIKINLDLVAPIQKIIKQIDIIKSRYYVLINKTLKK